MAVDIITVVMEINSIRYLLSHKYAIPESLNLPHRLVATAATACGTGIAGPPDTLWFL